MKSFSASIARGIRLRLKTGFIKEEPLEYTFMKRYPPLSQNQQNALRQLEAKNIPYLKLYDKVVKRNPLYVDERVYPAYWEHDITPLAIAKRQYDLMQSGMSEADAYYKALEHVEEIEAKAYDEMESLISVAKSLGATSSFASDENISSEIGLWREKLANVPYSEMSLADQGEIDYLIQSKILKWNPIQTEIRMKDPIFVLQFKELRAVVFPSIANEDLEDNLSRTAKRELDTERTYFSRPTAAPFFYEEYSDFFEKLKKQPMIGRWSTNDREKLSKWIYETLAVRDSVDRKLGVALQRYLDDIRDQFFPMVKYPDLAGSFELPSPAEMKELLFNNSVGYRTENNRLFVRRFYKIPRILFPSETFATSCASDHVLASHFLENPYYLSLVLEYEGFPESILPVVKERLADIHRMDKKYRPGGFGGFSSSSLDDDASGIDAVLGGEFDDPEESFLSSERDSLDHSHASDSSKESVAYKQMAFLAALISNWRIVIDELNTPGVYDALHKLFSDDAPDNVADICKGTPIEDVWNRAVNVIDNETVEWAEEAIKALDAQEIQGDERQQLLQNIYRRAFVFRAKSTIEMYYSLKDIPANSQYSFPMNDPFKVLDYTGVDALFPGDTDEHGSHESTSLSRDKREDTFRKSLKEKLGNIHDLGEKTQSLTPEEIMSLPQEQDWNKIVRKYYRAPKSKLAQLRENWLSTIHSGGNNPWNDMQNATSEGELKVLHRSRLDVQLLVRGELSIEYENKEGARRNREFKRRGIHMKVHPYPLENIEH